jgi:MGT family glycosyltransferase
LVPGHPSQLPVGAERYGIPATWPERLRTDPPPLDELDTLVDRVTSAFTTRWNASLATVAPGRPPVDDAFRVHGGRVLYNSVRAMQDPSREPALPVDHCFVGPLVRDEQLPGALASWSQQIDDRPRVLVALGTFLSHRCDVLARIADALQTLDVRVAIASGATPRDALGQLPDDWVIAPQLPQVAMLAGADLFVHHGGNNSVQEALAAGVRQVVVPFSTDQFSNAADLERIGSASVLPPNEATVAELAHSIDEGLRSPPLPTTPAMDAARLVEALFE